MRRARRRGRVLIRSLLLHVLVLALVGLGILARMSESSDVQLAEAEHAAALARLDAPASASPLPFATRGWSLPAPRADVLPLGSLPAAASSHERPARAARGGAPAEARRATSLPRSASAPRQ